MLVYERVDPIRFCCSDMRDKWDIRIGFGLRGHPRSSSREVNIFSLLPRSNGAVYWDITEINYCPWCGEVIEVVRVK